MLPLGLEKPKNLERKSHKMNLKDLMIVMSKVECSVQNSLKRTGRVKMMMKVIQMKINRYD